MEKLKYPRTYHFPWSLGSTDDDKILTQDEVNSIFENQLVIVTEKLDGENTTIYFDGTMHARSLDSQSNETRSWVKHLATNLIRTIPNNWRICGENVYAKHTISYDELSTYFYVFGIYDDNNNCLSWDDTVKYCHEWKLQTVPVKYYGIWDQNRIKQFNNSIGKFSSQNDCEGYVVRLSNSFHYDDFNISTAKYVRQNHVPKDAKHWSKTWIKNKIMISKND